LIKGAKWGKFKEILVLVRAGKGSAERRGGRKKVKNII
jgi:hypothetical protein